MHGEEPNIELDIESCVVSVVEQLESPKEIKFKRILKVTKGIHVGKRLYNRAGYKKILRDSGIKPEIFLYDKVDDC
jgi:hypothetical protein